jgi:DNA-binding Xre family transcriptional regulator
MAFIINTDVVLATRKVRPKELAKFVGITEQNLSLLPCLQDGLVPV